MAHPRHWSRSTPAPAALVAVDARTGAIRAAVSRPLDEFDRALSGLYPPGSTFKIVTTAALLPDPGVDAPVTCPSQIVVGGLRIRNADDADRGDITLRDAFVFSCNTSFAQFAEGLDEGALDTAAREFGFGRRYELPLPVAGGRFPAPEDLAERAAAAIGQARVQASPLHMATVAGAVASGTWRPPFLVRGGEGRVARLDPEVVQALRQLMREVVTRGTGTAADVPGDPVHGKTGSAEFGQPGPDGRLPTHAWFVGFRGDLAFAVLIEGGGAGGTVAAPIAARFLEALGGG